MNIYTAMFRTDATYAEIALAAATPEAALAAARALWKDNSHQLDWRRFDRTQPLTEIEIIDALDSSVAIWLDPEIRLRYAAADLLDALEDLVERDRAAAAQSGFTDAEMTWLEDARRAIAAAKGGVE